MAEFLLQRVAAGESAAVKEVMDRYGGLVWSLARRSCANQADAEDATQEIFLDIWKSAARFDADKGSETLFIAMIARRRLIDRIRRLGREPRMEDVDAPGFEFAASNPGDAEMLTEAGLAARAVATLKPAQQRVLALGLLQEAVMLGDVDLARVEDVRRNWPFLRDRRTDAYGGIERRYLGD
jgi:RNA polymerase sigma-70 factor (ECF subfamily)